jgi:hypothetical protein
MTIEKIVDICLNDFIRYNGQPSELRVNTILYLQLEKEKFLSEEGNFISQQGNYFWTTIQDNFGIKIIKKANFFLIRGRKEKDYSIDKKISPEQLQKELDERYVEKHSWEGNRFLGLK